MPSLDSPTSLEKAPQKAVFRTLWDSSKGAGHYFSSSVRASRALLWCWQLWWYSQGMFSYQGGKLQFTGHSGVPGKQWRRGLRIAELRVCGSKQISVKGNNFSQSYTYIMPVVNLFAGYCGEIATTHNMCIPHGKWNGSQGVSSACRLFL